jgi:hypothetical protein
MKIMKVVSALVALCFFSSTFAQEPARCGTDEIFEQQLQDPKFKRSYQKLERLAKKAEDAKRASNMPDLPITVPIIVHIIHFGEPYGEDSHLSVEFIQEAIDDLNQNFAGGFSIEPTANTQINFCIANASTTGEPIEGIRYYDWDTLGIEPWDATAFYNNHTGVSNLLGYDRNNYCNVFVAPFNSPLGFAYLPSSNYGVYVGTNAFGITNEGNYGLNRTLVHEMGHYCGLYHTFHNTSTCTPSNTNCSSQGDRVCDTPITTGNYGCPAGNEACPDALIENFMDYTNDGCMESFTQGQSLRMLTQLETLRPGVVSNNLACGAVGGVDASINGLAVPDLGCSTTKDIVFNLQSFGDTLTEATINYSINGTGNFIIWTGNLGFGESETITLSNIDIGYGITDIEVDVDVLGDIYETNNTNTLQINNYEGTFIDITIEFDALPFGFSWELFEADTNGTPVGEPIDEGGDYTNGIYSCETEINTYCLEEGNYVLVLEDLFGNGMFYPCGGPISIVEGNDTLNTITGNWGSDENLPFYVGPPDPCPPSDCPWDVDGNGYVWTNDILVILQYYGLEIECSPFDVNQDGVVGVDDILDAIANFNTECNTGELAPEGGFDAFLKNEQEGELVTTTLYNIMGQKVQEGNYLDTGIYIIVNEWNVPEVGVFITKEKIYHQH